jgi:hypothetical protein
MSNVIKIVASGVCGDSEHKHLSYERTIHSSHKDRKKADEVRNLLHRDRGFRVFYVVEG